MIYLVLAILCSSCISVFMRFSEPRCKNNISMLAMNYVMCTAMAVFFAVRNNNPFLPAAGISAGFGVFNGVLYLLSFVLLNYNVRVNGPAMSTTFAKLGVLVPTVLSMVLFHEMPSALQWIGIALACAAIIGMREGGAEGRNRSLISLLALLVCGGSADVMIKFYQEIGDPAWNDGFLAATFAVALALCVIYAIVRKQKLTKWEVLFGALIGIPNFLSSKFLLGALKTVPAVVVYPTYSVAVILTVAIAGRAFFGERFSKRRRIALAVILAALILLNV